MPDTETAMAKLAEIPPAGSANRLCWLLEAERHGFERTSGGEEIPEYDPPAYFATRDEVLTLMSEARKQGQRDVLAAPFAAGGGEILGEASFLLNRLDEFYRDNIDDDCTTEALRDWLGHVAPSISRLKGLLSSPSQGSNTGEAGRDRSWPANYQETFDAIAKATTVHPNGSLGISVKAFYRALSYPEPPTAPQGADLAGLSAADIKAIRDGIVQARGALRLDTMLDSRGHPYGTTAVALERLSAAEAALNRIAILVPTTSAPPAPAVGRDPGLPTDITDALDSFALAVNDMGETVDSRGMPDPDREEIVGQRRAALLAAIRGHLALAHPGSVAPTTLNLIRQARQAASAERALYGDSKDAGDLYDELADALGDAFGSRSDNALADAFRPADAKDWRRLFLMLDGSGHGRFWQERLRAALAALNAVPTPASQTEGERPCP